MQMRLLEVNFTLTKESSIHPLSWAKNKSIIFDTGDSTKTNLLFGDYLRVGLEQGSQLAVEWKNSTCKGTEVHMWPIFRDKFSGLWQGPSVYKSHANLPSTGPIVFPETCHPTDREESFSLI